MQSENSFSDFGIGKNIPDFEVDIYQKEQFKKVKLSDFLKKWLVLFFYPADFTFVCPTELEELANNYEQFKKLNTEILSISTDTTFVHKAWHDNSPAIKKIEFPMVADPTAKLTKAFGVYIENEGLARRGTFVIDPDGVLVAYEIHSNNIGRSSDELLRKIQAAQFVRENGGEVCPANWRPGSKTLKPGIDLVGKI
ncbi:MAG: alkyl hydroperoxide reductase subunit C [Candidatus Gracilibacteria bacterium]|jgi:peroxiredoxin (alkyl hydroperoxide reductase subunit C)